jgi:hypothetical protein
MENTYWNNNGKYQSDYDRLVELMPASGNCETVAGELIRAATRLAYDLYNNGMGNNTSGAVNFLLDRGAIDKSTHRVIYPYTRGQLYDGHYNGDMFQIAMEHLVNQTIEFILARPELETATNTDDLFNYEDDCQHFCEECGDETDGRGFYSSLCSYCEDSMQEEDEEEA